MWKLITYSEVKVPLARYGVSYCIGIVEDENGKRLPVMIDRKYSKHLEYGITGDIVEEWSPYGKIYTFKPNVKLEPILTVAVFGISSSIGSKVAIELAKMGYNIVGVDNIKHDISAIKNEVEGYGVKFSYYVADLKDESSIREILNDVNKMYKGISGVVNAIEYYVEKRMERVKAEEWRNIIDERLGATYNVVKILASYMANKGGGSIVNLVAIYSRLGVERRVELATVESAIIGLTRGIAAEYLRDGVRCNAVLTGFIDTSVLRSYAKRDLMSIISKLPMGRFGKPIEVAKVVAFLISDESSYINGEVLAVTGGITSIVRI